MAEQEKNYVKDFFKFNPLAEDFFEKIKLLYGSGHDNRKVNIIFSLNDAVDISFYNENNKLLLVVELTDYDATVKWAGNIYFDSRIDKIKDIWFSCLKNAYKSYKSDYAKHHTNYIDTL